MGRDSFDGAVETAEALDDSPEAALTADLVNNLSRAMHVFLEVRCPTFSVRQKAGHQCVYASLEPAHWC